MDALIIAAGYGSRLRDTAAVLALAEFKPSGVDLAALTERLADLRELARYGSTIRINLKDGEGSVLQTIWAEEGGRWKVVAFQLIEP